MERIQCRAVRRPSTIFFKSNRLSQFSSHHSDIWRECAQQYCPKSCGRRISIFASNFNGSLIQKLCKKIGILKVLGHFLKKFLCVKNGPRGPHFRAPNRAKIGQYIGFRLFSWNVFAIFTWNLIYKLIGATFVGVWKRGTRGPNFGPFWASKWVKIQVFEYFVEKSGLDLHQSWFICALELLSEMCNIWASNAQFLGHFGPQSKKKFWCLITFSKNFHCFHNSFASHAYSKYF